jgi:hypothetical protein
MGLPHALAITTADVTDLQGAVEMTGQNVKNLSEVKKFVAGGGYAEVKVVKRNELYTFVVLPKRWVVERSFGWIDKARRLWKNCGRKPRHSQRICQFFP